MRLDGSLANYIRRNNRSRPYKTRCARMPNPSFGFKRAGTPHANDGVGYEHAGANDDEEHADCADVIP